MRREDDLSDSDCGMVVSARWASPNISEAHDLLGFTAKPSQGLQRMVQKQKNIQ